MRSFNPTKCLRDITQVACFSARFTARSLLKQISLSTSSALNILCNNIIEDGWMAQWEQNKRQHLDPLLIECARFISESRYVLDPVRQNKGMFIEKSGMDKLRQGLTLYLKKKAGMAPAYARVATHKYVG